MSKNAFANENKHILLEWFVECSWIFCKDSANENKIIELAWMVCRVQLNILQRFCKREQNHQACLNGLPSAAEYSAKILQTRTKSPSLLEWFAKCRWIFYKVTLSFSRTQWYSLLHVSQSYIRNVCIYINNLARAR